MPKKLGLDDKDMFILSTLHYHGDITNKELAETVELSTAATLKRVRKLKEQNYILDVRATLNYKKLGYDYHVILFINIREHLLDELLERIEPYDNFLQYWVSLAPKKAVNKEVNLIIVGFFKNYEQYYSMWSLINTEMENKATIQEFPVTEAKYFLNVLNLYIMNS